MTTVSTKSGRIIKVVSREEEKSTLTESDNEMDERAVEAVKAAINKAKICKKPIAGYDNEKKQAYVEYANGKRKYVNIEKNVIKIDQYNNTIILSGNISIPMNEIIDIRGDIVKNIDNIYNFE